jgi:hypothetical protein
LLRSAPEGFIDEIRRDLENFEGTLLTKENGIEITTIEGKSSYEEALASLTF